MIIVEGCDGSGKTRLIQQLQEHLEIEQGGRACTSLGPMQNLRGWISTDLGMRVAASEKRGLVYDRYPLISEPIYGPITRGYIDPTLHNQQFLQRAMRWLISYKPLIIFCIPPLMEVRRNIEKDEQMAGVKENLPAIYDAYFFSCAQWSALTSVEVWDYTDELAPETLRRILDRIAYREVLRAR